MSPKSIKTLFQVLQLQWKECLWISSAHVLQTSLLLFILVPVLALAFLCSVFAAWWFYSYQSHTLSAFIFQDQIDFALWDYTYTRKT